MINVSQNFIYGNSSAFGDSFSILIDTRNTKTGGSASNEFLFPQNTDINDNAINFLVDWGDGQFSRITSKAEASVPHVYATPGIYTINFYKPKGFTTAIISPRYESYSNETNKILKVLRWGVFNASRGSFQGCINLDLSEVEGTPLFPNVGATGERTFSGCTSLTTIKNLSNIIFQGSTTFLFANSSNFNQSFVFNAGALSSCFFNCTKLNSSITINSNTSITLDIFRGCTTLNAVPIMNTPNLTSVEGMFRSCTAFNKDVSTMLDWSKITNMHNFMNGKSSANYNAAYYDNLLIALDAGGQTGVTLGMGAIKYTSAGLTARNNLQAKGWAITDGGLA